MFPKKITLKSGAKLIIREANSSDAVKMIDYVNLIDKESKFLTREPGEFNKAVQEEETIILNYHKSPNELFLLAVVDDKIVGMSDVASYSKKRLRHIGDMGISVKKAFWDQGVGSALMQSVIDWAKANGITRKLNLKVQENNERAIALYKKFGFRKEGVISRDALIEGEFYADYCMGLEID